MTFRRTLTMQAALALLSGVLLFAQDWKSVEDLAGVDWTGISAPQKTAILKGLRETPCSCGCGMKLAECRVKDPACTFSRGLATIVVTTVRSGKSVEEGFAAAAASKFAHPPQEEITRILEDPISIPVKGAPVKGAANAAVTLVEFSDFQCPYCVKAVPQIDALLKAYPTQVRLVFKQFPLDIHSQAAFAAAVALGAHEQGKFWQMHDALFSLRGALSREAVMAKAAQAGVDVKKLEASLASKSVKQQMDQDVADGDEAGVQGTPTLFINGKRYNGPILLDALKPLIEQEMKSGGQRVAAPQPAPTAEPVAL